MKTQDLLEARLLLNELLEEGTTFDSASARRLIELVPVRTAFNRVAPRGDRTFGHTQEMGNVTYEDPAGRHDDPYYPERINGFGLHHEPGMMVIANEEGMKSPGRRGMSCTIDYDPETREPVEMRLMGVHFKAYLWGVLTVETPGMVPWKTPRGSWP